MGFLVVLVLRTYMRARREMELASELTSRFCRRHDSDSSLQDWKIGGPGLRKMMVKRNEGDDAVPLLHPGQVRFSQKALTRKPEPVEILKFPCFGMCPCLSLEIGSNSTSSTYRYVMAIVV